MDDKKSSRSRHENALHAKVGAEQSPSMKKSRSVKNLLHKLTDTPPPTPALKSKSLTDLTSLEINGNEIRINSVESTPSFPPLPNDPDAMEVLTTTLDNMHLAPNTTSTAPTKMILTAFVQPSSAPTNSESATTTNNNTGFNFGYKKE
ncbi:MAG: hypothetical protein ABSF18_01850 [Gammaproteobacteria bacterium]|jgi:hypothetical protein